MEKRIDPDDGMGYTFKEVEDHYSKCYTKEEIQAYWENECTPVQVSFHEVTLKTINGTIITITLDEGDRVRELRQKTAQQLKKQEVELKFVCAEDVLPDDAVIADVVGKEIHVIVEDVTVEALDWLQALYPEDTLEDVKDVEKLRELTVGSQLLSQEEGYTYLANLLILVPHLTKLESLSVTDIDVGDEGATALANVLPSMTSLKFLHLRNTNIGGEGAAKLTTALPSMTSLERLDLVSNKIGTEGAEKLTAILPTMTSLKQLWLCDNKIEDAGAAALATALPSMSNLQHFAITSNDLGAAVRKMLREALPANCKRT